MQVGKFGNVFGGVDQLETDPFAVSAGREPPAFDNGHLVRCVGVLRVVGDPVNARLRDDLTGFEFLGHSNSVNDLNRKRYPDLARSGLVGRRDTRFIRSRAARSRRRRLPSRRAGCRARYSGGEMGEPCLVTGETSRFGAGMLPIDDPMPLTTGPQ